MITETGCRGPAPDDERLPQGRIQVAESGGQAVGEVRRIGRHAAEGPFTRKIVRSPERRVVGGSYPITAKPARRPTSLGAPALQHLRRHPSQQLQRPTRGTAGNTLLGPARDTISQPARDSLLRPWETHRGRHSLQHHRRCVFSTAGDARTARRSGAGPPRQCSPPGARSNSCRGSGA